MSNQPDWSDPNLNHPFDRRKKSESGYIYDKFRSQVQTFWEPINLSVGDSSQSGTTFKTAKTISQTRQLANFKALIELQVYFFSCFFRLSISVIHHPNKIVTGDHCYGCGQFGVKSSVPKIGETMPKRVQNIFLIES